MHGYLRRKIQADVEARLAEFPVVAVLGPRQCGKTTLIRETVARPGVAYLDLERPSDRAKLRDPELFFSLHRSQGEVSLFCLDEIQRAPEIFPLLRSLVDEENRGGQFLLLGSASGDLLRQTSESLAGRIAYLELTPFLASELPGDPPGVLPRLWLRGGFPRSFLATSDASSGNWRESFSRTFLERDIPQLGIKVQAPTLRRLWRMIAHHHGQLLNSSQLAAALGVSSTTIRGYLDLLIQTFMLRRLEPFATNTKKRIVKSPKVYLRDSGILHSLLHIDRLEDLLAHPVCGASWEGLVLENIVASLPGWQPSFYRTANGAEVDLVLERGRRRLAVECKASTAPVVSRGFWNALDDLGVDEAWVVAPVAEAYPLREGVTVTPLRTLLDHLAARESPA